jgi:HSP20 family protein
VIRIVVNATTKWRLTSLAIGLSLGIIEGRQENKGNLKMTLIRWQPFQELETLRRQMDHMFDEMNGLKNTSAVSWQPAIEVQDADDNIILRAEIPGIEAKDLDVRVTREAVSLSGEHRYEHKTQAKGFFRSEFRYGKFGRVIPLPVAVHNDQVKADFSNGVLTLTLPKVEAVKNRVVKLNLTESSAAIEANSEQPTKAESAVAIEANSEQPANTETGDVWTSTDAAV